MGGPLASTTAVTLIFAALFGLVLGSFIGALSYRLPRKENVAKGRSACPKCRTILGPRDLVPVLSWIASRGLCRYCGTRISWRYPAIELANAVLFVVAVTVVQDMARLGLILIMTPIMVALAVIDLEQHRLPNALIAPLAILALGYRFVVDRDFLSACIAAVLVFMAAVILDQVGRRSLRQGLGMGDAKLMTVSALALPIAPLLQTLTGAGLLGVVTGLLWRISRCSGEHFPFGPAILVSFWVALVFL